MNKTLRKFTVNSGKYVIIIAFVQTVYTAHIQLEKEQVQLHSVSLDQMHSLKAELTAPYGALPCILIDANDPRSAADRSPERPSWLAAAWLLGGSGSKEGVGKARAQG